jgi:aminopeptidase-like protein
MSTVDERATDILAWMINNRHRHGVRRHTMLAELGLNEGTKTYQAIRRAAFLAHEIGQHVPAACWSNGYEHHITTDPHDAIQPAAHLMKIAVGVLRRAGLAYEFMDANSASMDADAAARAHTLATTHQQVQTMAEGMLTVAKELAAMNGGRAA